ncbi:MAG: hypothetical protein HY270_05710 [Deltaproteobacteria bacterium]|nr:hypothetical protein [Deltaproteobacteria bacterium]
MRLRSARWICATFFACGCGIVTANNRELLDARTQLNNGDFSGALASVDSKRRDDLCAILDRAVIYETVGQVPESNREFDRGEAKIKEYENRAVVSATEAATGVGSLLVNDKMLEYQGEGYEKVLLHAFKARNYLLLGKEEDARVEIRNANMRQDEERKRHQDEINKAKAEAKNKKVDLGTFSKEMDKQFAASSEVLKRLDNVYQNPFATYLSATVYELNGEADDAFIDLKHAYEMTHSPTVAADLVRVAGKAHRADELKSLGLQPHKDKGSTSSAPAGNTLIFIDNGLAPERVEIKFPIPEPDTVLFAAMPMTKPMPTDLAEVEVLRSSGEVVGKTEVMVDIEAMAVRNLHDRYPGLLLRQAIRLAGKAAMAHEAKAQEGVAGALISTAFNLVTEQADLRGWYALPRSIHVARVNLPDGEKEVRLRLLDPASRAIQEVTAPVLSAGPHLRIVSARYINGHVTLPSIHEQVAADGRAM